MGILKDNANISKGLAMVTSSTGLRGRWETIRTAPTVSCDTGHNVGGWQYLGKQILKQPCKQLRMVFGMVDDKDIDTVCKLLPKDAIYYFTQATTHRAIPAEKVKEEGCLHGLHGQTFSSVKDAYEKALEDADESDFIFVGGSSYIVADFLTWIG